MIQIKVINKGHQQLPAYTASQSAGMDLKANLEVFIALKPVERKLVSMGFFTVLPERFEAQVRPHNGLALKYDITVLNMPGTIGVDYRGKVMVLSVNLSREKFVIRDGERTAQMVTARYE